MNLTLHLTPELEAKIREQATALGVPIEEAAIASLRVGLSSNDETPVLPLDKWMAAFDSMVATTPHGNVDADFDRESIYEGRGE